MSLLFTPGPLNTSKTVKDAMGIDVGSRAIDFIQCVQQLRSKLVQISGASPSDAYTTVLMQGSGTFAIESVISSVIAPNDKLLVLSNGRYGERMTAIAKRHKVDVVECKVPDNQTFNVEDVIEQLKSFTFTHVALVHHETTAGVLNPIHEIVNAIHMFNPTISVILDSMSAFGAYDTSAFMNNIDYLVSSANKNLQGVPGFAFVICKLSSLLKQGIYAKTVCLDLLEQYNGLEKNGQFRFTPPTHTILAFHQAVVEFEREGGITARYQRYARNNKVLIEGLSKLGFEPLIQNEALRGVIITTFLYPNEAFDFNDFYMTLASEKLVIYPGKLVQQDSFRIGNIGDLEEKDMKKLLQAIETYMQ